MKESSLSPQWHHFISIVRQEVKPAIGCTEPVSLALAAAIASTHLAGEPRCVEAWVSANLMKNGMGVTIPGSGMCGLSVAAALGALCGEASAGLEVLKNVTKENVTQAKQWIAQKLVHVNLQPDCEEVLYARVRVWNEETHATVTISGHHTRVVRIEEGDKEVFRAEEQDTPDDALPLDSFFSTVTLKDILAFTEQVPLAEIAFIREAASLNDALSREGLRHDWGLHIGATLARQRKKNFIGNDLLSDILIRTAAASDARMGGAALAAMSNSGSGNQGIAATLPVLVVADHLKASQEALIRALMLSHLTAIYIHSKLPTLSALCAATTASMGAAAGMILLMGGGLKAISKAINSMVGDVSGIICDGASNSCAMKVSTGAASALKASLMALENTGVSGRDGIVSQNVEHSLNNLCALACQAMPHTDRQVLEIMLKKSA
ncbi:serine dehydratase subunit alpha family protein [Enterobacteriaceae bacterium 89]|nr:serine dehydratase subunit alpha family protein [Enterobacteriaceae bacterium 89]